MTHYAIIRQPIYISTPFYQDTVNSRYSHVNGHTHKYEKIEYGGISSYLINVIMIDESFSGEYKVIFEGKVNLNEYNIGDIVEVGDENYVINDVTKSTSNKITYTVSEPYLVKCDDYNQLLEECERKFEECKAPKIEHVKEEVEIETPKKKGFWSWLLG